MKARVLFCTGLILAVWAAFNPGLGDLWASAVGGLLMGWNISEAFS